MNTLSSSVLAIGKIVSFHGIQGDMKVRSFMENPEELFSFSCFMDENLSEGPYTWKRFSPLGPSLFRGCFSHVHSRTHAEKIGRATLYVSFDFLKETQKYQKNLDHDTFYYAELCGMDVVSVEGKSLGKVKTVHNFGAGHLLELHNFISMIPFRQPFVVEVHRENATIVVEMSFL